MNLQLCTRSRILLLCVLVFAFLLQSYFIYSDQKGQIAGPLSLKAKLGHQVWLQNNCQACHQIYGFGGFLGPDLTNRASYYPPEALAHILKVGPSKMPSFNLSTIEIEGLHEYFLHLNRTGTSQPKIAPNQTELFLSQIPWFEYNEQ